MPKNRKINKNPAPIPQNKQISKDTNNTNNKKSQKKHNKKKLKNCPQSQQDDLHLLQMQEQQLQANQGIFEQLNSQQQDQNENSCKQMENQPQNQNNDASQYIPKCQFSNGYFFMIDIGKCYKILNKYNIKVDIVIIDGQVSINGKIFKHLFNIKQQSNLIIKAQSCPPNSTNKSTGVIKKSGLNKNLSQIFDKMYQNTNLCLDPELVLSQNEGLCNYLHDYDSSENILLFIQHKEIQMVPSDIPWQSLTPKQFISSGQITMLMGAKNTGKSYFCQYLINTAIEGGNQLCVLDLDIGRNRLHTACISFTAIQPPKNSTSMNENKNKNKLKGEVAENKSIWIGEYTPLNSVRVYIKAVESLYKYYKQKYFTSSLIINTMGYLTGIGQLILYQIFDIVKPQKLLVMQANGQQQWTVKNITNCISSGEYLNRLHLRVQYNVNRTSTKIQKYKNKLAEQKPSAQRFQSLLTSATINSFYDLLGLILNQKLNILPQIPLYSSSKSGQVVKIEPLSSTFKQNTQMRLVIIGNFWENSLFQVHGLGYIWQGKLYYDKVFNQFQINDKSTKIKAGLICQGIDFQKSFYTLSQAKLIQIECLIAKRLPYFMNNFRVLGSKGVRNNPAKKVAIKTSKN